MHNREPLVSIITSTWDRFDKLFDNCMPSVYEQNYPNREHIIVSDGRDAFVRCEIEDGHYHIDNVRYYELGRNFHEFYGNNTLGTIAKLVGTYLARGEYIAYLDDDNVYKRNHIKTLMDEIREKEVDFVYSRMYNNEKGKVIGSKPPRHGHIDTSVILHHVDTLKLGNWRPSGYAHDWDLVNRWLDNGATWSFVNEVTVDYGV